MAEINKTATVEQNKPKFWPIIGKAWINKTKKTNQDMINVVLDNRREPFETITFKRGDKIVLRANTKRPGKQDADFQVCLPS